MKKSTKIILGLNTLLPLLVIALMFFYYWNLIVVMEELGNNNPDVLGFGMEIDLLLLYLGCVILSAPLIFFYLIHIRSNAFIPQDQVRFWQTFIFILPVPVVHIYWYKFIWKQDSEF